ncbi:MAG: tetratricopeptide repeat protein [Myxococcales bacterium]|nr:tetratricopeptide repeat protein [Myxococcales bacterium]
MIDIHPEDLLDREREGSLTADERLYLSTHLKQCAACRIERQLAFECAAERELLDEQLLPRGRFGPGLETEHGVNPQVEPSPSGVAERRASSHPPRSVARLRRGFPKAAVVVAGLFLAGGAAALGGALPWTRSSPAATTPPVASVTPAASAAPSKLVKRRWRSAEGPAPAPSEAVVEVEPPSSSAPAPPTSVQQTPLATASQLFAQASAARRDGDYQRALTLYERLIERYPNSAEARTARAVRARLLLDLGHTTLAEKSFREASKGEGPLSEAALVGEAQALRRAGKSAAERAVWRELLRRFPGSPKTALAKARLSELGD